ncbi:MAG: hypothetical protein RRA94_07265 [Bacteroidota bacterium]|nr:hypothetical protein [Bacteroidota bacterium]
MNRLLIILITAAALAQCAFAQDYLLRYDPDQGSYTFKQLEETTAMAQSNDGRTMDINRKTTRYLTVDVEAVGDEGISYTCTQDTAIVEESTADPRIQRQNLIVQNILTGKPVRVRQSLSGVTLEHTALVPLQAQRILGPSANDAMFTPRAVILPVLPDRPLTVGMRWTEKHADTLQPSKSHPQYGTGSGIRYQQSSTEYEVAGRETIDGTACLRLTWEGRSGMEEKVMYGNLEEYTEETTRSSGEMLVEIDSGLPRKVDVYSDKEATRALFGAQSSVIPSSISTHTVLDLISH